MDESQKENFNHLKIHSQYSICEGAIKIDELKDYTKENKIKAIALCDSENLCGALEFAEKLSKVGTQPIIGSQINFKIDDTIGLLPLFALNENGYKRIIELSSLSYLKNDNLSDPHLIFDELLNKTEGLALFSGTTNGLFGKLFNIGKFNEIQKIYAKLKSKYEDRFYIEIQRHGDQNEIEFEKFNLSNSLNLEIPLIATNEVYYLDKNMHEAHDALICIKNKTYINEKNRVKYSNQHYLKNNLEMNKLFADLPEALENNYNFPYRCSFRPVSSKPILPNISSNEGEDADEILKRNSIEGLKEKFEKIFKVSNENTDSNESYLQYKDRLDHELDIII